MLNKFIGPFIVTLLLFSTLNAQELNVRVAVNADQVQSSDRTVFKDMETAFAQFLNSRQWTTDVYESFEKINANIIITLQNPKSIGVFEATVQVQAARPVYNTNYESILLNFADRDWQFEYVDSQPLEYNDQTYISNLTSLLAYYSYMILGMDYDSFSELGGTDYFQQALNVVNNAQQSGRAGWDALGSTRNRYWLVENLTNQQIIPFRRSLYRYHRLALDTFDKDPENSRKIILEVLKEMRKVKNAFPNSILVIAFLDAKRDELINIFSEGSIALRREAYDILAAVDPSKSGDYEKMIK
ncbi:type IX secretion system protein PorD [Fulvivirga lutea]|uniref:DUF4835 family protein n=1 Tax=Fulvivirga lutea TaxID=2810512 RepID=A0A975A214_9BACT|nr:DUF4835 family protein [Fulvivirga lutea]QSE98946.1 DUF4835 family protein [Fulvivirga lutea]